MISDDQDSRMQGIIIREYLNILQDPETTTSERISVLAMLSKIHGLTTDLNLALGTLRRFGLELSTDSVRSLTGETDKPTLEASKQDLNDLSCSEIAKLYKDELG